MNKLTELDVRGDLNKRFDALSERVALSEKIVQQRYQDWVRACEALKVCEAQRREVWLELVDTINDASRIAISGKSDSEKV